MQEHVDKKWGKMGKILGRPASPRPADLAPPRIATSLIQGWGNTLTLLLSRALKVGLIQWPERLHPWIEGLAYMQDSGKHLRTASLDDMHALIIKSMHQRDESARARPTDLDQVGRPPVGLLQIDATSIDTRSTSGPSRRRTVPRGLYPRPAGLDEAGWLRIYATVTTVLPKSSSAPPHYK
jgi:hypothetical protein